MDRYLCPDNFDRDFNAPDVPKQRVYWLRIFTTFLKRTADKLGCLLISSLHTPTNLFPNVRLSTVILRRYTPYTFAPQILYSLVIFLPRRNKKLGRILISSYKTAKHTQRIKTFDRSPLRNTAMIRYRVVVQLYSNKILGAAQPGSANVRQYGQIIGGGSETIPMVYQREYFVSCYSDVPCFCIAVW